MTMSDGFDQMLRDLLSDAAPITAPVDLHPSAMARARRTRQRANWSIAVREALTWPKQPSSRGVVPYLRVAAIVVVICLSATLLIIGFGGNVPPPPMITPAPTVSPSHTAPVSPSASPSGIRQQAETFDIPFTYVVPAGSHLRLVALSDSEELYGMIDDPEGTAQADAYHELQVAARRGIAVVRVNPAAVHPCPVVAGQPSRVELRSSPAELVEDLQAVAGLQIEDITTTTLDGWPAVAGTIVQREQGCAGYDIHLAGTSFMTLNSPAHLTVAEIDRQPVMVYVWAGVESPLADWLPIGEAFLGSMDFVADP